MKLEEIGFYTLSNVRALCSSATSDLQRCELILTDRCNFKCVYCRGLRSDLKGNMPLAESHRILDLWISQGLKNVRFSGGEPTLYKGLLELVEKCRMAGVEHIAVSSNGSADWSVYNQLLNAGVNDFSISLDSGCCSIGDDMAGGVCGSWDRVVENIRYLSAQTYVTVGMVFTEKNVHDCVNAVLFADSLGVSDIRVIPAAQYNKALSALSALPEDVKAKYRILKYRIDNTRQGFPLRGIAAKDSSACWLALDDMAVAGKYHFPCIIYMREGGEPIGEIGADVREQRKRWADKHDTHKDKICREMCLDVCIAFNNVAAETHTRSEV
jgi:MoaA/NifB/PqqE/SkfB family radical SAM enzyme